MVSDTKFQKLKQAMKSPPPERLAAIEYRSHFLQAVGVTIVSIVLILKGYWYIIFAFIFSIGISYSQGMVAYQKYNLIMSLKKPESFKDYQNDISPTRKRSKIINHVYGNSMKVIVGVAAIIISILIVPINSSRLILNFVLVPIFIATYVVLYFFPTYWIALVFYNKELKGGRKNDI